MIVRSHPFSSRRRTPSPCQKDQNGVSSLGSWSLNDLYSDGPCFKASKNSGLWDFRCRASLILVVLTSFCLGLPHWGHGLDLSSVWSWSFGQDQHDLYVLSALLQSCSSSRAVGSRLGKSSGKATENALARLSKVVLMLSKDPPPWIRCLIASSMCMMGLRACVVLGNPAISQAEFITARSTR